MRPFCEALEDRRLLSAASSAVTLPPLPPIVTPVELNHLAATPIAVHAEATDQFSGRLAKLPANTAAHVSELGGTVDWGDGSATSPATFNRLADGTIYVNGSHTYAKTGNYNIKVTVTRRPYVPPGQANPFFIILLGSFSTAAKVTPDDDGGVSLTENASTPFTAKVGSFDFPTVDIILGAVKIDWGDGRTGTGMLKSAGGGLASGEYDVIGTHTYAAPGNYKVHITVATHLAGQTSISGTAADFFSTVKVNPIKPSTGGMTLNETTAQSFTTRLGEFTYKTVDQALNAVIDWGDGTISAGTLDGSYVTGEYYVLGTHKYAHAGTYKVGVIIRGHLVGSPMPPSGPLAQFTSVAVVNDKTV